MDNKNNKTPQKEAFIFIAGNNSFFVEQEQNTYGIFSFSPMTLLTPLQVWRPPIPMALLFVFPRIKNPQKLNPRHFLSSVFFIPFR